MIPKACEFYTHHAFFFTFNASLCLFCFMITLSLTRKLTFVLLNSGMSG